MQKSDKNNKFKISARPTWNEDFQLPYGSYYISNIQPYFEYIFKKGEKTVYHTIGIYVNKIENRMTFKTKTGYYLKLLTSETMKLFGSTKSKLTKDEHNQNFPCL